MGYSDKFNYHNHKRKGYIKKKSLYSKYNSDSSNQINGCVYDGERGEFLFIAMDNQDTNKKYLLGSRFPLHQNLLVLVNERITRVNGSSRGD